MGLIHMLGNRVWLLLSCAMLCNSVAASTVALETRPWPTEQRCDSCVTIQFVTMEFKLPLHMIGRVLDTGGDGLHILPPSEAPKQGVLLLAVPTAKLLGRYEQSGLLEGLDIKTNEQLFDALGAAPGSNKSLAVLRRIEGIDTASRYYKVSRDSVHAYWIQSPEPGGSQNIYVVINDDETVYLLSGDITQEFLDTVLSNLRVVELP